MKFRFNLLIFIIFPCIAFSQVQALESKKLDIFDKSRGRNIPTVIYQGKKTDKPAVIISHGYGVKNSQYCFIANALVARGYFVVSIQHDLESDKPLPTTSDDEPDEGIVPESGIQVIYAKGARHIDLCDLGSEAIKDEIQKSIIKFLSR